MPNKDCPKLRECPLCGSEAKIVGGPEDWYPTSYDPDSGGDPYSVVCTGCECGMALAFWDSDEAVAAWNRRADHSGEGNGMIVEPDNEPTCGEKENFVQTKYGYCFYALDSNPLIYNLYVHPQYRRCGHSKGLLDLVINEVRKSGHKGEIHIQARPREGIGMEDLTMYYKRMGLSVCDRQKPEGGEGK